MSGKIISFEGIEGSGKSTQVQKLKDFLSTKSINSIAIREPGNTYIGEQIRHLLQHDPNAHSMCPETELLLFEASRAQLVREIMIPAMDTGKWIICDRFFDSSTAYQGAARKLSSTIVNELNHFAAEKCIPHLTILLDMDVEIAFQRLQQYKKEKDRIECESIEFFHRVRERYLQLADQESERFYVIDATLPIEEITQKISIKVQQYFKI